MMPGSNTVCMPGCTHTGLLVAAVRLLEDAGVPDGRCQAGRERGPFYAS